MMIDHNKDEVAGAVSAVTSLGRGMDRDKPINSPHAIPPCIGREIGDDIKMGAAYAEDLVDDPEDGNVRIQIHGLYPVSIFSY